LESFFLRELVDRIAEHGRGTAGLSIAVDEGCAFDAVVTLPVDRKGGVGFFDVERFGVVLAGEPECEVIVAVDDPGIAGFAGEQRELTDCDDAPSVTGGAPSDLTDLVGKTKACTINRALVWAAFAC